MRTQIQLIASVRARRGVYGVSAEHCAHHHAGSPILLQATGIKTHSLSGHAAQPRFAGGLCRAGSIDDWTQLNVPHLRLARARH